MPSSNHAARLSRRPSRPVAARLAVAAGAALPVLAAGVAFANSGVHLRLDNYTAGSETTSGALVTNGNFEAGTLGGVPTGWTQAGTVMVSGTPDAANLPVPSTVLGSRVVQATSPTGIDPFSDYKISQAVTLAPNTDYVLSGYLWNYAFPGPPPQNDLFAGDLAVLELVDPADPFNTAGVILEPTALDNNAGSRGYFVYKTFNSSQFAGGSAQLEVEFDPNQDIQFAINRPNLSAQWDNISITPLTQFSAQRFTSAAGGSWDTPGNWLNGVPNAIGAVATFRTDTTGSPPLVTLPGARLVSVINFDANGGYVIGGAGTLVLDHDEQREAVIFNNLKGSNSITAPIVVQPGIQGGNPAQLRTRILRVDVANTGGVLSVGDITPGSVSGLGTGTFAVVKNGPGRFEAAGLRAESLTINQGEVRFAPGSAGSRVGTLTITGAATPTARLSVTNNAVVVDYTGTSPLATIRAQILAGFAGGAFTGNGIVPGYLPGYAVGFAEAADLATVPPAFGATDSTSVLLRGTLSGDANLDGSVNIGDFSTLAANFNTPGEWIRGDFNYSGTVEIGDFSLLAANFNRAVAGDLPRGATVPEPAGAALLLAAGLGLLGSRRRR